VKLQKVVTLQLYNDVTFNAVGLEWVLIWKNLQQTAKYCRLRNLQQLYPYVPRKSERETKGKIERRYHQPWIQQWLLLIVGSSSGVCVPRSLILQLQAWVLGSVPPIKHKHTFLTCSKHTFWATVISTFTVLLNYSITLCWSLHVLSLFKDRVPKIHWACSASNGLCLGQGLQLRGCEFLVL